MQFAQLPSSETFSLATIPKEIEIYSPCKVCGDKAHGVHFGVMACRACAAFYRRFIVLNLEYECLNDPRKCAVDSTRRSSCRHCRFQKCLKVGMTTDNVQFNRDVYSQERRKKKNASEINGNIPSTSLHRSELAVQEQLYRSTVFEECKNISIRIECEKIFQRNHPNMNDEFGKLNHLQKIAIGLEKLRAGEDVIDIKFNNRLSFDNLVPHWACVSKKLAELVMHSWAFRNIDLFEQLRIFKYVWKTLHRLERLQMTVQVYGEKCVDEKKIIINCERAIQLDALFMDIEGISKEKKRFTLTEFKKYANRLINEVARPLCKFKFSTMEVSYMLCMVCQYNEQQYFGNNVTPVSDAFEDEIANNLHQYYMDMGIHNYAPRIQQIMKCVIAMKRIHNDDYIGNLVNPPTPFKIDQKCAQQ
ncbi:unnamed protein product [Caenorhabditis angaria]|uniref:Nuclear receptor domain-containing protein n=1 Tax=Caenorhabditis angaria TaxID=860376 RepID=A0A9P1IWJ2_9PELO|nr:unnamed protein product [Caenorhabditis angaria]